MNADDIGRTNLVKHVIETGDAKPVHQQCRRFCKAHIKVIRDTIAEQHASGIIRPSSSNWASNQMIVKKMTGKFRVFINYRGFNGVIVNPYSYMLPRIDDISKNSRFCWGKDQHQALKILKNSLVTASIM